MLTLAEAKYDVKRFRKLFNCENNPHLRKHYKDKLTVAEAVLRNMIVNGSDLKPPRTPWARMNIRSDYFEALR